MHTISHYIMYQKTARKSNICYSQVGLNTSMSYMYIVMHISKSENDKFISHWKVAGALVKPIRITTYPYKPCGISKTV